MIHVYLDDLRPCPQGFVPARSADECVLLLQECEVGVLSLDFDLGWGEPDGLQVVRYMVAAERFPKEIYIHTSSDSGRSTMYQMLYQSKPDYVKLVNSPMPYDILQQIANNVKE
ncbi:cell division protein FtsJ [Paenibacillus xerothermodurans]|uniref:Cell division protein FtsJ n=1 Tax=Paenibacillus xerothermodurans TaxID=1977292 RepID=A0A2W1NCI0_PAEXE|nr:cyclic-phosphate processing receiver domain-containing protein [Paenibacillus xerothermodurans]PZE22197.1 cell division protein FtsJ [Paenibacillus xerothermodurans]